jgi:hypothetical protein
MDFDFNIKTEEQRRDSVPLCAIMEERIKALFGDIGSVERFRAD